MVYWRRILLVFCVVLIFAFVGAAYILYQNQPPSSPTPSLILSPSPTSTTSPTVTPTSTLTISPSPSPSPTPSPSPSPTITPSPTPSMVPPKIEELNWKPIRVVNDKVYDSIVYFTATSGQSTIVEASVIFVPKLYSHLPFDAFPKEPIREFILEPIDGEFDENTEEFLVNITTIKGGREYVIDVTVKDEAGNIAKASIMTPYIREFENLGKQLYEKGIIIGVSYFEYYPDPVPWDVVSPRAVNPLLGEYNVRDSVVIAKHIDWLTGHGVNCLFLSWGWDDEINHRKYHENYVNLVSNPMINQTHIAIQYEVSRVWFHGVPTDENGIHLDDPAKWKGVIEDFKVLNNTFFNKENYLKINGKPYVYWYNADALVGKVGEFLDDIRSTYKNGIFIISDHAHPIVTSPGDDWLKNAKEFDGWSVWAAGWYIPVDKPLNENFPIILENGYKFWHNMAKNYKKVLMPSIIPGFVELRDPDWINKFGNLPRDVDMYYKSLTIAFKYATPIEGKKIIKIDTFNDFGEGTNIEPTIEEGFIFLEALKDVLTAPLISNFSWSPLDMRNEKIYSLKVCFKAEDLTNIDSTIENAELHFIPMIYEHLPKEAFPEEKEQIIPLTPIDGVYDEAEEEFEAIINNIKGGREYIIKIIVENKEGNVRKETINLPYIREFENLGKQLYEKGIKIGIIYGLITDKHTWDDYLKLGGPYEPLLGYYVLNSTKNLIIINKHLDWMSGHGINFILDIWSGRWSEGDIRDRIFQEAISTLEIFKTGGMKFGILYETHWRFVDYRYYQKEGFNMSDPNNIQILKEDLSYLTEKYFNHPAYLKIKGKPFFFIYGNNGMYGNIINGLKEVYEFMKENYELQLYMVSDHALPEVDENWGIPPVKDLAPLFDAMLTTMSYKNPEYASYEDYLKRGYEYWYNFSLQNGLDYIPFFNPGGSMKYCPWHPPELRESDPLAYPRSVELWKKRITMSIPYSNTFGMMVGDWNNVFENGHIEPTVQEGWEYLEVLKNILTKNYLNNE